MRTISALLLFFCVLLKLNYVQCKQLLILFLAGHIIFNFKCLESIKG